MIKKATEKSKALKKAKVKSNWKKKEAMLVQLDKEEETATEDMGIGNGGGENGQYKSQMEISGGVGEEGKFQIDI